MDSSDFWIMLTTPPAEKKRRHKGPGLLSAVIIVLTLLIALVGLVPLVCPVDITVLGCRVVAHSMAPRGWEPEGFHHEHHNHAFFRGDIWTWRKGNWVYAASLEYP